MNLDFLFILVALTLISGIIILIDKFYWSNQRTTSVKKPLLVEYSYSFFSVFLIVVLIRSFVGQIFHVPTGSLEPTVMPGDFILVTQYNYGLKLPIVNKKIVPIGTPKRGDIVVFFWPVNPNVNFVKRLIGLPGDKISYINQVLYVNGQMAPQKPVGYNVDENESGVKHSWSVQRMEEDLSGIKHQIYQCSSTADCPSQTPDFYNVEVPPGYYFMMGDNRDNSEDSRIWGFVPEKDLVGKAQFVLFNWHKGPDFSRIGKSL